MVQATSVLQDSNESAKPELLECQEVTPKVSNNLPMEVEVSSASYPNPSTPPTSYQKAEGSGSKNCKRAVDPMLFSEGQFIAIHSSVTGAQEAFDDGTDFKMYSREVSIAIFY